MSDVWGINPYSADFFNAKPWRRKVFFQVKIKINVLVDPLAVRVKGLLL